jgi:hypothetical protein
LLPRRFALVRHVDYTGVSGIGVVAYGVQFGDGHVVLRWRSRHPSTISWASLDDLLTVHGHGDGTTVQWIDSADDTLTSLQGLADEVLRPARPVSEPSANGTHANSSGGRHRRTPQPVVPRR